MLSSAPVVTSIPVVDLQRAKAFYLDKLGLKEGMTAPDGGVILNAGEGTRLFLYQRGQTKADHTVASFKVADVLGTVNALKAKGVQFESYDMGELKTDSNNIARMGDLQACWFKDPEGNILCVSNM
jgi:catechol 2,3-dioxygenase-like lactoylglutathione lyase family enzyme